MVPATQAERRPRPTMLEKEGSWPEPPPEMRETFCLWLEEEEAWP